MKKLLCLSLAVLMSTSSIAVNWRKVISYDKSTFYVDDQSITKMQNGNIKSWVKSVHSDHKDYESLVSLTETSCSETKIRLLYIAIYYNDGTADSGSPTREWIYAPPGSLWDNYIKYVCKK